NGTCFMDGGRSSGSCSGKRVMSNPRRFNCRQAKTAAWKKCRKLVVADPGENAMGGSPASRNAATSGGTAASGSSKNGNPLNRMGGQSSGIGSASQRG